MTVVDRHRQAAARLLTAIPHADDRVALAAAALADAERQGRESVGLGDFLPDPCGDEIRSPLPDDYGWLSCGRRAGHDGDHEEGSTGFAWPRDDDGGAS